MDNIDCESTYFLDFLFQTSQHCEVALELLLLLNGGLPLGLEALGFFLLELPLLVAQVLVSLGQLLMLFFRSYHSLVDRYKFEYKRLRICLFLQCQ